MLSDVVQQALSEWWAPLLAFAAGVVSFASPCVLPLVPGYLSFVAGEGRPEERRPAVLPILLFVLGFSIVFTVVGGFTASALGQALRSSAGQRVAGGVVLAFGLFMLLYAARARVPLLYREARPWLGRARPGTAGALPLGMAFAVGWTPCIGPVLAAIITLAGSEQEPGRSVLLLFAYSLGLGLPFLLLGMGIRRLTGTLRFFSRHYRWFAGGGGVTLALIGILLMSGAWTRLLAPLLRIVNRFTPPI